MTQTPPEKEALFHLRTFFNCKNIGFLIFFLALNNIGGENHDANTP